MDGHLHAGLTPPVCYVTPHVHSQTVLGAFAAGCGAREAPPDELLPGSVAVYGILRGTGPLLREAQAQEREFYYVDNGYFRAAHYTGFYRCTRNAYQYVSDLRPDAPRWRRLGLEIKPWRSSGRHILVCPPGDNFMAHLGHEAGTWLRGTIDTLTRHTAREIRVRAKPSKGAAPVPLEADLSNCHAVVAYTSNVAVQAVLAGVPAFVARTSPVSLLGNWWLTLHKIETPIYADNRESWAATLAGQQWTLDEFRDGTAWRSLTKI